MKNWQREDFKVIWPDSPGHLPCHPSSPLQPLCHCKQMPSRNIWAGKGIWVYLQGMVECLEGVCGEAPHFIGEQEAERKRWGRREEEGSGSQYPLQEHAPIISLLSIRPYLIKIAPYPNSTISWWPSLQHRGLWGPFKIQTIVMSIPGSDLDQEVILKW